MEAGLHRYFGQAAYARTRAFYERSGFRCEAQLADFYASGDDRVIYTKVIAAVESRLWYNRALGVQLH